MSAKDALMRYATPLTTWLFLISLVSGVALFFGVGSQYFREMHEILSMLLIVPFVLHVWRNWTALINYFRRSAMWISTVLCLVAAGLFAYEASGVSTSTNPRMALFDALGHASLPAVAALANTDVDTAKARLAAAGIEVTAATDTVDVLAERAGRDLFDVIGVVLSPPAAGN